MADFFEKVNLSDFFDIKDNSTKEILKNGGISNYFREDSVKSIFAIYLMAKKDIHLFEIIEPGQDKSQVDFNKISGSVDAQIALKSGMYTDKYGLDQLSAEEKKALGQAFIEDIKKHRIYGEVPGGKEQVEANVKWYGEMFSKAMDVIDTEIESFPTLDDFSNADNVCEIADSSFAATGKIASDFLLETESNFQRRSNRSTKINNYGVDIGKAFLEGYGGSDKYNKDSNRMKSVAVVSTCAKRVSDAVKEGDTAEAVSSLISGQMALKYREDLVKEHDENITTDEFNNLNIIDHDTSIADKMETAATLTHVNYKNLFTGNKYKDHSDKFAPLLKGEDLSNEEDKYYDEIIDDVITKTQDEMTTRNVSVVKNIIGTINMNNNSDIYSVVAYEGPTDKVNDAKLPKVKIDLDNVSKATLIESARVYDEVFASLIDSESTYMKKVGKKYLFDNFKIDGKPVSKITRVLKDYTTDIELYSKYIIISAMASKKFKLTYSPYKASDNDWNKVVVSDKNIEITRPANISRAPYTELNAFRRDLEGIIEGYEELKLIKSFFHINRKLFTDVTDSLMQLKTMTENIYEKNILGETVISEKNWNKVLEQYNNISETMNAYIKARTGATSELGKKRLKKITSLYGNINAIKTRMSKYVKQTVVASRIADDLYGDDLTANADLTTKDQHMSERNTTGKEYIKDYDYMNPSSYTKDMKEIYTEVKTADEEHMEKLKAAEESKKQKTRAAMLAKLKKGKKGPVKK